MSSHRVQFSWSLRWAPGVTLLVSRAQPLQEQPLCVPGELIRLSWGVGQLPHSDRRELFLSPTMVAVTLRPPPPLAVDVTQYLSCLSLPVSPRHFLPHLLPISPFIHFLSFPSAISSLSPNHFLAIQPTSSSPFCHFLSLPWASPGASCAQSLAPRVPGSDLTQRVLLSSVGNSRPGVGLRTFSGRFPLKWLQSYLHKGTSLSTFVHEL